VKSCEKTSSVSPWGGSGIRAAAGLRACPYTAGRGWAQGAGDSHPGAGGIENIFAAEVVHFVKQRLQLFCFYSICLCKFPYFDLIDRICLGKFRIFVLTGGICLCKFRISDGHKKICLGNLTTSTRFYKNYLGKLRETDGLLWIP
jgi:hypothetical protein